MTADQANEVSKDEHAELLGLIPAYVKDSLTGEESAAVRQHLETCEICRQELASCQALVEHFPAPKEDWKPSPSHFAGILAELDKLEAVQSAPQAPRPPAPGLIRRIGAWLSQTPLPVRWTLAVETLAFAALTLFVVLPLQVNPKVDSAFETLSDGEPPAGLPGESIRLVFAEDMTTRELSELLRLAKAQLRQGPSVVGSYTAEVPAGDGARALASFRAHPKVRLAQPIQNTPPGP